MAIFGGSRGFVLGFATGFGTGLVARDALPHIKSALAPSMKLALRISLEATERSREMAVRLGEFVQDTLAEVRMEMRDRGTKPKSRKKARKARTPRARVQTPRHKPVSNVVELNPRASL